MKPIAKSRLDKKIAGGALLVCLSGFVPSLTRSVRAASATINATGSFSEGLQITPAPAGGTAKFGQIVATGPAGTVRITPGGGTVAVNGFVNGGTAKNATLSFNAGATRSIDVTVAGLKNTLTLGTWNGIKTGIVNFSTVKITGPFKGTLTFTIGLSKQAVALTNKTVDMRIGGAVTWGVVQPIGTFSHNVTISVSF